MDCIFSILALSGFAAIGFGYGRGAAMVLIILLLDNLEVIL